MIDLASYQSIPVGALLTRSREEEAAYIDRLVALPPNLARLVISPRTGAFVRGIVKSHKLPLDFTPQISFIILQIAFGDKTLAQLSQMLSQELKITTEQALTISQEIERELFVPVVLELNQAQHQPKKYTSTPQSGARNIIDLKNQKDAPPLPPPLP